MSKNRWYTFLAAIFLFIYALGMKFSGISATTWPYWALVAAGIGQTVLVNWRFKNE